MKIFYKVLASIGMIALSTSAAIGIRHLVRGSKKKADEGSAPDANAQNRSEADDAANDEDIEEAEDSDDAEDVEEAEDSDDAEDAEDAEKSDNA